jgi:hypothetical protein
MGLTAELHSMEEKNPEVENGIRELTKKFGDEGIDYLIIGSVARVAYMGSGVPSNDIDILIPFSGQRTRAQEIINSLQPMHPEIYFDTSLADLIEVDESSQQYHLKYGFIDEVVKAELFKIRELDFEGISIKTIPPATLLHMYTLVGGPFREKDWNNSLTFARWMKTQPAYSHELYWPFHSFGKRRWNESPLRKMQYVWRQFINYLPGNLQNKTREIYNLPLTVKARVLFNTIEESMCGFHSSDATLLN